MIWAKRATNQGHSLPTRKDWYPGTLTATRKIQPPRLQQAGFRFTEPSSGSVE